MLHCFAPLPPRRRSATAKARSPARFRRRSRRSRRPRTRTSTPPTRASATGHCDARGGLASRCERASALQRRRRGRARDAGDPLGPGDDRLDRRARRAAASTRQQLESRSNINYRTAPAPGAIASSSGAFAAGRISDRRHTADHGQRDLQPRTDDGRLGADACEPRSGIDRPAPRRDVLAHRHAGGDADGARVRQLDERRHADVLRRRGQRRRRLAYGHGPGRTAAPDVGAARSRRSRPPGRVRMEHRRQAGARRRHLHGAGHAGGQRGRRREPARPRPSASTRSRRSRRSRSRPRPAR